jgi:hypothetical protein
VLNPDIRFDSDVLAPLLAQAAPDAGLLTPRILEPGKAGPEPHRALLTPLEIVGRNKPGYVRPPVPAWIPGLFMLFRSEAYRRIGGFDERFFMYGEDFDICARTRLAGWKLQVGEDLLARHDAQRASHRSKKLPVLARDQPAEGVALGRLLALPADPAARRLTSALSGAKSVCEDNRERKKQARLHTDDDDDNNDEPDVP